jgi:hypothetical protein
MTNLGLTFGAEVRTGVMDWVATHLTDPYRKASLKISARDLGMVDFASPIKIIDLDSQQPIFTGVVTEALFDGLNWTLELRTGSQELSEIQSDGLVIGAGIPVQEGVRSMLATAGIPDAGMKIYGLSLPLPNPFAVIAPIDGLRISDPIAIGDVVFVGKLEPSMAVDDLATADNVHRLRDDFQNAETWAHTIVQSSSLDEAEVSGLRLIDLALAQLTLTSRFSFSNDPKGHPHTYSRHAALLAKVDRRAIVHVRALRTPHRWLRGLNVTTKQAEIHAEQISLLSQLPTPTDPKLRLSLNALRRCVATQEPHDRVSALWQVIELYVSSNERERPSQLFSSGVLRAAFKRAAVGLNEAQGERLLYLKQIANEPPLLLRLEQALAGDGVPYDAHEMEALKRTRKVRNDLEHGQSLTAIQSADINLSISLVIRILVFAISGGNGMS